MKPESNRKVSYLREIFLLEARFDKLGRDHILCIITSTRYLDKTPLKKTVRFKIRLRKNKTTTKKRKTNAVQFKSTMLFFFSGFIDDYTMN